MHPQPFLSTHPPSPNDGTYLRNILFVQPPRLGEKLEAVSMRRQVTCSDHDGSVVQVSLGNAGLKVAFKPSSPIRAFFICWLRTPNTWSNKLAIKGCRDRRERNIIPVEEGGPITTVSIFALAPSKTRRSIRLSDKPTSFTCTVGLHGAWFLKPVLP